MTNPTLQERLADAKKKRDKAIFEGSTDDAIKYQASVDLLTRKIEKEKLT